MNGVVGGPARIPPLDANFKSPEIPELFRSHSLWSRSDWNEGTTPHEGILKVIYWEKSPVRPCFFIRSFISSDETSSTRVAIYQTLPVGSFTAASRSPKNWVVGSSCETAPASRARLYTWSTFST